MVSQLTPLPPGSTLGVLGGGQLGRMFVHCAQRMGYKTAVLDPDPSSPAGLVSHHFVTTDYLDPQGLEKLISICDAVTTEFENVPAPALEWLSEHLCVNPAASAVCIAQDRVREKEHFTHCGVPVAPYCAIETPSDLECICADFLPGILKTARLGYDGKGQVRVQTSEDAVNAWRALQEERVCQGQGIAAGASPYTACVLEKLMPIDYECSIILARDSGGRIVHLPAQRNIHRDGILALTQVHEGCIAPTVAKNIAESAASIATQLNYVGVLCVEFFVLKASTSVLPAKAASDDGSVLVVNEIAPRPHNSGHYSVEACDISQFELQVRCLAQLPLLQPRQLSPALMLNLLGDLWFEPSTNHAAERLKEPVWAELLSISGVHLNLYAKSEPKRRRKMGHLTITAPSVDLLYATLDKVTRLLCIPPFERP